ncbi:MULTISPECIES: sugar phosphate isomerase/epimerase family protein [Enorma]|uniref:sugar phosphate isomerase/epimerase family protein n=1 Tax=Enorma TaxID=1472762 RepID=UPI0003449844|nr:MULTISPECIES: sugar phosphate isomerase/epimerase [Enorma]
MRFLPTNQIWRYWSFERFLTDVASLDIRDVDLWLCNQHVNIDAHAVYNASEVARLVSRYGVRIRTLTPEQSNPKAYNIASSDSQVQRLTEGYYRQIVSLAARLGARRISVNAGWRLLDDDPSRAWDALCTMLRAICHMAAEEGIEVCVEPLSRTQYRLVMDADGLSRLLGEVNEKNLRATLDTGTIARNGDSLSAHLREVGERVGYVHLTNLDPHVFAHLGWGDSRGVLEPGAVLQELEAHGYEGDCALEMTASAYYDRPREALARSIETLKGCER